MLPALVAWLLLSSPVSPDPLIVLRDPAALALDASDLPRRFAPPDGAQLAPDTARFAATVRACAAAGSFDVAVAEQALAGSNGPIDLLVIAVLRGDPQSFAAEVAKKRADAPSLDSRRFGNV